MKIAIFMCMFFSSFAFAAGSKPINIKPGDVNYELFPGNYKLVKSSGTMPSFCNRTTEIQIETDPSRSEIKVANCKHDCSFEKVNDSRRPFNSCFSDGLKGYSETVGNTNVIVNRTIFQKPGFFCMGEREGCRMGHYIRANQNGTLQFAYFDTCYDQTAQCEYEKR